MTAVIDAGATAQEAFLAIQSTAGRGRVGERWVLDHVLRRHVMEGVDLATTPVSAVLVDDAPPPVEPAMAVLMAGGQGSRLQPLTFKVPKPLLQVGRTTILERLLEHLFAANVRDVWISVNYMAELIEERIGDGTGYGVQVRYLREDEPLWTAGALSLLPEPPRGPVLVLNTDQITTLQFGRLVDFHVAEEAAITVASVPYEVTVPYGVLATDGSRLLALEEKPTTRFQCNGGFYVVGPEAVALVPRRQPLTLVELMQLALDRDMKVAVFPILETWIDIGTPDDLQRALMTFATGEELS